MIQIKPFFKAATIGAALFGLAACSSGPSGQSVSLPVATKENGKSQFVFFHVPSDNNSQRYVTASILRTGGEIAQSGNLAVVSLNVRNQYSFGGNATQLRPVDPTTLREFAENPGTSASASTVINLGRHVVSQTVCKGMAIEPSKGRRFSGSEAHAVLAANGGRLTGATIPSNVQGRPASAIEYSRFGWQVRLDCK